LVSIPHRYDSHTDNTKISISEIGVSIPHRFDSHLTNPEGTILIIYGVSIPHRFDSHQKGEEMKSKGKFRFQSLTGSIHTRSLNTFSLVFFLSFNPSQVRFTLLRNPKKHRF